MRPNLVHWFCFISLLKPDEHKGQTATERSQYTVHANILQSIMHFTGSISFNRVIVNYQKPKVVRGTLRVELVGQSLCNYSQTSHAGDQIKKAWAAQSCDQWKWLTQLWPLKQRIKKYWGALYIVSKFHDEWTKEMAQKLLEKKSGSIDLH